MKNHITKILLCIALLYSKGNVVHSQNNTCNSNALKPVFKEDFGQAASSTSISQAKPGSTNYTFGNVGTDGNYIVTPRVENANKSDWSKGGDHTGNTNGNMFLVNAGGNNSIYFRDTAYNLCQGSIFNFTAWLANVNTPNTQGVCGNGLVYAKVIFRIKDLSGNVLNSVTTGLLPLSPNNGPLNWQQYGFQFSLPAGVTSVIFEMVDFYGGGAQCGNDLALDDILFTACTPQVTANVSSNSNACLGTRDTISSSLVNSPYVNPAYQWQKSTDGGTTWINIGGASTTASSYVFTNVTNSDNGLYRVIVGPNVASLVSQTCVAASNSVPFTVNPAPVISVSSNNPVCDSSTINLTATITGGTTPYNYSWKGPNGFASNTLNPSKANAVYADSGYYTFIITDAKSCRDTAVTKVNVTPVPTIQTKNYTDTVCSNTRIKINLKSSLTTSYFKWQSTVLSGSVSGNTNQTTATTANQTITDSLINIGTTTARVRYIVMAITDSGCVSKPDTLYVIVQPKVTNANAGISQKLCNATTATLSGNTPTTGNGVWTQIGLPAATIANANAASTTVSGLTGNNNYYFVWKISGANICPTSSDTVMIINRPSVTVANAGNDTIICNYNTTLTGSIKLHANIDTSRNFETGVWNVLSKPSGSSTSFSNSNSPTAVFNFNKTGLYQLTWTITNDNNCTPSTSTINITVYEKPFAGNITASTVSACAGSNISFTLNNYIGNIYKWQYKTKANNWIDSLINTPTISFNNVSDTISVRAITTSLSNACSVYDTTAAAAIVNINPQTVAGILSADATVCSNSNHGVLHLKNYVGNILYWQSSTDNGNTWNNISNTTDSLVYNNLLSTTKYRTFVQSGVCASLISNTVTVIVAQPVTPAKAGFNRLLCFQDTIHLQANTPTTGTGIWQQISGPNTGAFSNQNNAST
ncbi:MAG: hypothetical protein C0459_00005, partial [Chitinophaga sp.]|nr:hypothetical protein [Chitinophaga sp.]